MQSWGFLKKRAMVAALGALLVFGGGATVAVSQLTHHFAPAGQAGAGSTASGATDTATTGAAATATAGAGSGGGANATATAGATATSIPPTPTSQQPTPTSSSGQAFHQIGAVTSVDNSANSFTMTVGSTTYTIVVITSGTPKTEIQINGVAYTDLSHLTQNMQADVEGQTTSGGKILAFSVDAKSGGGGGA